MDRSEPRTEVAALRKELNYHRHRYFVLDDPEIPDAEYDALFDRLVDLETSHPELVISRLARPNVSGRHRRASSTKCDTTRRCCPSTSARAWMNSPRGRTRCRRLPRPGR